MEQVHPLEKIYEHHHRDEDRHSGMMHTDERGLFLKERVGTGKMILDIGCRNGALTAFYAGGNTVLGVDIDTGALAKAKERLGIDTMQVDLNGTWPFQKNFYNAVIATEVLEHLYFPETAIEKIVQILKKDGMLLGSVPNAFSLINRVRLLFARKRYTPLGDPTHITHFTRTELFTMLRRHFAEVKITPLGNYAYLDKFFPGLFAFMFQFEAYNPIS